MLVSIRRKSAMAFPNESNPQKVALKIDLNEFTSKDADGNPICDSDHGFSAPCVKSWHGMKKLSLESGDDINVVTEGFAWYLHRLASEDPAFDYTPGLAAWIRLFITKTRADGSKVETFYNGVFVNVERRDKQFLKNHGLWAGSDDTWLYKYSDRWAPAIKVAPEDAQGFRVHSPFFLDSLYHEPFQPCDVDTLLPAGPCDPLPAGDAFVAALDATVNTEGLIVLGAVSGFLVSGDDLFSKGKNFYHVDYSDTASGRREYLQWDLDSAMAALKTDRSIYRQANKRNGEYEAAILGNAVLRERYSTTMRALLEGPLAEQGLLGDLDAFQALLGAALDADPYSPAGSGFFDSMRSWVHDRTAFVRGELGIAGPVEPPPAEPGQGDRVLHVEELSGTGVARRRGKRWEGRPRASACTTLRRGACGRRDRHCLVEHRSDRQLPDAGRQLFGEPGVAREGEQRELQCRQSGNDRLILRRQCRPRERTSLDLAAVRTGSARTHRGSPRGISRGDWAKDPIVSAI